MTAFTKINEFLFISW